MNKILITGPESVGKSHLAKSLANQFDMPWVPEHARYYLEQLNRDYEFKDLIEIANQHIEIVEKYSDSTILILDSYLLNIKIWAEFKYNEHIPIIEKKIYNSNYKKVLLLKPNIKWEYDPLRENPNSRDILFDTFKNWIEYYKWPYSIIDELAEKRTNQAVDVISSDI